MVRKKTEGNEEQRREAARRARSQGTAPSAMQETTGASKQRDHLPRHEEHDRKSAAVHRGKQQWQAAESREAADARLASESPPGPEYGSGQPGYTGEHEQVLNALASAQDAHGGEGVYPEEIARRAGMAPARVKVLLHDLSTEHRLVTQLRGSDSPDLGPRFEVNHRL
jgi:hypothetical protein